MAEPIRRRNRLKLLGILAVCAAPVIASYLTYYVIKPDGRTNYGTLIEPQIPLVGAKAEAMGLSGLRGKWVLATTASAGCDETCAKRLYLIRQVRLTTGKERDRVERLVWLDDGKALAPNLQSEHEGLQQVTVDAQALRALLSQAGVDQGSAILVIDPLGNLMMRFPADPDPSKMKKDLTKLLRASRVG